MSRAEVDIEAPMTRRCQPGPIDHATKPEEMAPGRGVKAFSLLAREDCELFEAVLAGEHCLRGSTNSDIRNQAQSGGSQARGPGQQFGPGPGRRSQLEKGHGSWQQKGKASRRYHLRAERSGVVEVGVG